MISVKNLEKQFGDIVAVNDLTFNVKKGTIFGIVGPDGAGKSTLLRMLSGILRPNGGTIQIGGLNIQDNLYAVKEHLAYMPQRFGLYEDLTVEENIVFFGKLFGVSKNGIRKKIPLLYEFSRLAPFKDRLAGKLSGGMKQKLGLACSLVHDPELILLDEPTNGVDPVSRMEFWKILNSLFLNGVTIIVSTAYLDEAERCGRLALMNEGSFIREGSPLEIKKSMNKSMLEIITDDIWKAESILKVNGKFNNIIREGNSLKVFTSSRTNDIAKIKKLLTEKKMQTHSVREKLPSLEDCFMEIVAG